jgi:hypothetical protein
MGKKMIDRPHKRPNTEADLSVIRIQWERLAESLADFVFLDTGLFLN